MPGVRKLRSFTPEEFTPPANLWEVLVRGRKDTFPIHTALWLFKNACGRTKPFGHIPGSLFAFRLRDREARHTTTPDECRLSLLALAWFLCLPAYGKGYLAAGPTATVHGSLSEGFAVPPVRLPARPLDLPPEVQAFLREATFPLSDLPTLTWLPRIYCLALWSIKSSVIFGPLETQLVHRAEWAARGEPVPDYVERDLQRAMARAVEAFDLPSRTSWEYDRTRQEKYLRAVRCRKGSPAASYAVGEEPAEWSTASSEETSVYSPPYWGPPIFDLRPLFREAQRLVRLLPEAIEEHPRLCWMTSEDWALCHGFVEKRKFSKKKLKGSQVRYPKNADFEAAWDWVEHLYGLRVRQVLYPSDRRPIR